MFDRKAAFEDYVTKSFVQKKKKGSKVISREKGKEIVAYLSAGEDKGDPLNGMQCFRLTTLAILKTNNPGISIEDATEAF